MFIGATAGGYVPVLFGSSLFSVASIVGNTLGGALGVVVGYKVGRAFDLRSSPESGSPTLAALRRAWI